MDPGTPQHTAPPVDRRTLARRSLQLDDEHLLAECAVDTYVASGPGGQHRNKTESGVRLLHLPTGVMVTATERRSQPQNRSRALERLRTRLQAMTFVPKVRRPTKPSRASKQRRLDAKRRTSDTKRHRRSRPLD